MFRFSLENLLENEFFNILFHYIENIDLMIRIFKLIMYLPESRLSIFHEA
jgi:hypothetical protein